jgi:hypothetical protein
MAKLNQAAALDAAHHFRGIGSIQVLGYDIADKSARNELPAQVDDRLESFRAANPARSAFSANLV